MILPRLMIFLLLVSQFDLVPVNPSELSFTLTHFSSGLLDALAILILEMLNNPKALQLIFWLFSLSLPLSLFFIGRSSSGDA